MRIPPTASCASSSVYWVIVEATTTVDHAPLSVMLTPVQAVNTRSWVRSPFVASVTYSAPVGAQPPHPPEPLLADVILPCASTVRFVFVYDHGVTAVFASLSAVTASSAILAVVTALFAIVRAVEPVTSPVWVALLTSQSSFVLSQSINAHSVRMFCLSSSAFCRSVWSDSVPVMSHHADDQPLPLVSARNCQ